MVVGKPQISVRFLFKVVGGDVSVVCYQLNCILLCMNLLPTVEI
jgi:hypothetical protein